MTNKWTIKTIGELPIVIGDGNYSSKYPSQTELLAEGIPFISNKDIKMGKILRKGLRYLSEAKHLELKKGHIKTGDILISTRANIGDAALVDDEYDDANINAQLVFLRVDEKTLHNRYLYQLITSELFKKIIQSYSTGSAQAQLPIRQLLQIPITYPEIVIQQKIGDILSSIDEAIQKTDQIIQKSEELKSGLMNELLTKGIGHKKFKKTKPGEIPDEWEIVSLSEVVEKLEADVSVNSEDKQISDNEFGILKTSAVTYGFFDPNQNKRIIDKDLPRARIKPLKDRIIISRMNTPLLVGASAYVDKDYENLFLPDRLWQIELKANSNIFTKWLSYQFSWQPTLSRIRELASGTSASMKNISKQKLLTLEIVIPPYQEQVSITELLNSVDNKINKEKVQMNYLKQIKNGLMHDIFNQKVQII